MIGHFHGAEDVGARREIEIEIARVERLLKRRGVVGLSVTFQSEGADIGRGKYIRNGRARQEQDAENGETA